MSGISERPAAGALAAAPDPEVEAALRAVEPRIQLLTASALITGGDLDGAGEILGRVAETTGDPQARAELCEQLLRTAEAWADRRRPEAAEAALRAAARMRPERATAALARHLQRHGAAVEALTLWAEAARLDPARGDHHLHHGRLLEAQGRFPEAHAAYLRSHQADPTARHALRVAQALERVSAQLPEPPADRAARIAVLGSATLDPLRACLVVGAHRAGLRPSVYLAGFDQHSQEILDARSGLHRFAPDMAVLAVHRSRLFPELSDCPHRLSVEDRRAAIERGLATVRGLLSGFREHSRAVLLLHGMVVPQHPALGIADARDELGERAIVVEINRRLAEIVRSEHHDVYLLDEDAVQARCGKAGATDPRLWLAAAMPWSDPVTVALAGEHLRHLLARRGLVRKCLVLDLDDTLWGGVVGEDGAAGVDLGATPRGAAHVLFQREIGRLRQRGVLLAICSKNDEAAAAAVFETRPEMRLRLDDFAARRIDWEPKPENVAAIAAELGIGLDSIVFWDDSTAERARMRAALPEVLTPEVPPDPALYRQTLVEMTVFDTLALTAEDVERTRLYAERASRRRLEDDLRSAGRLDDYLRDLRTVVQIAPASEPSLPRIAQLTRKTNQFNLTTLRLTEAEVEAMQARGRRVLALRVADRFGDSGLVGVGIAGPSPAASAAWEIDVLLLSCRVLGRGVESALLARLARDARDAGATRLVGRYLPTERNRPARDCFRDHGFRPLGGDSEGDGEGWELDLETARVRVPEWLEVRDDGPSPDGGPTTRRLVR
jgi:FkbH-like protein